LIKKYRGMIAIITKCLVVYANSPNKYRKKCMENGEENMHVDIGAPRVK